MKTATQSICIQIDTDSLGDVPCEIFESNFREELENAFPNSDLSIEYGSFARIDHDGFDVDPSEAIHECSEKAFKKAITQLNN